MKVTFGIVGMPGVEFTAHVDAGQVLDRVHKRMLSQVEAGKLSRDAMMQRMHELVDVMYDDKECQRIAFDIARIEYAKDGAEGVHYFMPEQQAA